MIQLQNISFSAGAFQLNNLNLKLEKNKFHVLLGSTGSGKTIILELVAGLLKPNSGKILLNTKNATQLFPEKRNIAYVPQDGALFPNKTVFKNISYGLELSKSFSNDEINNKVIEISELLEIKDLLNRNIDRLSGGEKQRVALARALILNKKIILLDEPTAALHETMQEDFCLLLKNLHLKFDLTILMTTHSKDSAFLVADTLHFIDNGKMLLSVNKENVYQIPLPLSVAELLGVRNIVKLSKHQINSKHYCYYSSCLQEFFYFENEISVEEEAFLIGIRPYDLKMVLNYNDANSKNTILVKVIAIMVKDSDALVQLNSVKTGKKLIMQISSYNISKFEIEVGKQFYCKINEPLFRVIYAE